MEVDRITSELDELGVRFGVARNADVDYYIDVHEPARGFAFTGQTFDSIERQIQERDIGAGVLLAYVEAQDIVYAAGYGTYQSLQMDAFQEAEEYFETALL